MSQTSPIPGATYRLQFNRDFTFKDATALVEYLDELGITDCYASPLFKARVDSTHGYDVCDFNQFNPNLGGAEAFDRFATRLRERDIGLILDLVPNHMGADLSNAWWFDVLEKGRESPFAAYFDIDWEPLNSDLHNQILLPILEDHYAKVLESGKLRLGFAEGAFSAAYYDKHFPISPRSYGIILEDVAAVIPGKCAPGRSSLKREVEALSHQSGIACRSESKFLELKRTLQSLHQNSPGFRKNLELALQNYNGCPGSSRSFDKLHALLQAQHYRFAFWKVGPEEINYRRFFDVNELVSLRMELPEVFKAAHVLVFSLLREGKVTGLRIDHPDGLWNPEDYLSRLQEGFAGLQPGREGSETSIQSATPPRMEAPQSQGTGLLTPNRCPLYVVAEKILTGDESLPEDWQVEGTTGYDFLNRVNGLFIQTSNRPAIDKIYSEFTSGHTCFKDLVYSSKRKILDNSLISELNALANRLQQLARSTRYGQDFTFRQLHASLAEVLANFPVYRTYITEQNARVPSGQEAGINLAIAEAGMRNPNCDKSVLKFINDILLCRFPSDLQEKGRRQRIKFAMRFQQLTGPVMAKGLEDTAFYNYNRLISLNEVGGSPEEFGVTVEQFHRYNTLKAERWPHSLLATATHDTKRGEDVRARINVLSEIPEEWHAAVLRWSHLNSDKKTVVDGCPAPCPNDEYSLYQTLVGAWPSGAPRPSGMKVFRERILSWMLKALREAKAHTSWTNPNIDYEKAAGNFVNALLQDSGKSHFLEDFTSFQRRVAFFGRFNSLSQTLLKMASPGVPDIYQGTELWDLSLVDPDNRRPVDFANHRELLARLKSDLHKNSSRMVAFLHQLLEESQNGKIKLFTIYRALAFRRQHRELFERGNYIPLSVAGVHREHLCAFERSFNGRLALAVAPRLIASFTNGTEMPPIGEDLWKDTWLYVPKARPAESFLNLFTNETLRATERDGRVGLQVGEVLAHFPVALLTRIP